MLQLFFQLRIRCDHIIDRPNGSMEESLPTVFREIIVDEAKHQNESQNCHCIVHLGFIWIRVGREEEDCEYKGHPEDTIDRARVAKLWAKIPNPGLEFVEN